jgi:hypothetical protein
LHLKQTENEAIAKNIYYLYYLLLFIAIII